MNWCFAIINNRLAEIYWEEKKGKIEFIGHCYVKKEEFKTKEEQKWIRKDTKNHRFVYRKGRYRRVGGRNLYPVKYILKERKVYF